MNKLIINKVSRIKFSFVLLSLILLNVSAMMIHHCGQQQKVFSKKSLEPDSSALIETELYLYLNDENKTSNPNITTYSNQLINVTVSYKDAISKEFVSGATVDVNGSGISEVLGESHNNYTVMIDTNKLNFGASFLTIYARKEGYEPQSIIIPVQIIQIETVLNLYLNGENKTSSPSITIYTDQSINLTVSYKDKITSQFISGATVDVNGSSVSEILVESHDNYMAMIDTSKLNSGANNFTIYSRKMGYEPQSIIFTIQVVQIKTVLNLFLNGANKTLNPVLTTYTDQLINLTVSYKEAISMLFISGATVDVNGSGISKVLGESYNNYSVIIDTSKLKLGANLLTIYARKEGYEPQSIIVTIQIKKIETGVNITLNGNSTTFLTISIGKMLNITVNYFENASKTAITGATVRILGGSFPLNLEEDSNNHQYSIVINTNQLDIGGNLLTVYCNCTNYQPYSANLEIQVNRIFGTISREDGGAQIEVYTGVDVLLKIILKDPQNETIKDATVAYNWTYGQGELDDLDNDGIYAVTFLNVQEGTHNIMISAYAGDNYDFEQYIITLNAYTPPPFILYSNASTPDTDGSFFLLWTSFYGAHNFSIYESSNYITKINESETILADKITDLNLGLTEYSNGTYYFIVVAHGDYGDVISNCIKIDVEIVSSDHPPQIVPGYDLVLLLGAISIIGFFITRNKLIQKSLLR